MGKPWLKAAMAIVRKLESGDIPGVAEILVEGFGDKFGPIFGPKIERTPCVVAQDLAREERCCFEGMFVSGPRLRPCAPGQSRRVGPAEGQEVLEPPRQHRHTRARSLYERFGFAEEKVESLRLMEWLFGIRTWVYMVKPLNRGETVSWHSMGAWPAIG